MGSKNPSGLLVLVYAIREAAAVNLKNLVEKFGLEWAQVSEADDCKALSIN